MNYEGRREWLEAEIKQLFWELEQLKSIAEFGDPGIYYQQVREGQDIERRIEDLIHELREMDEGV